MYVVDSDKQLQDYSYIIGLDLALYHTGISVYKIDEEKFVEYEEILFNPTDKEKQQTPVSILYFNLMKEKLEYYKNKFPNSFLVKEQQPLQCGFKSTISTLMGLNMAHTIISILCYNLFIDEYDDKGIHSISVKALHKTDSILKPTKIDIMNDICREYDIDNKTLTDNISDSMAVVDCLIKKTWNAKIQEQNKELKKHLKTLTRESSKEELKIKIEKNNKKLLTNTSK